MGIWFLIAMGNFGVFPPKRGWGQGCTYQELQGNFGDGDNQNFGESLGFIPKFPCFLGMGSGTEQSRAKQFQC